MAAAQKQKRTRKVFSVEEANQTLPLVRMIARDLAEKSKLVAELRLRLTEMTLSRSETETSKNCYSEEVEQMQTELEREIREVEGYDAELRQLGVEPMDRQAGVVVFPSTIDGDSVRLCWRLGEPEVMYWHRVGEGFDSRRRLGAGMSLDSETF